MWLIAGVLLLIAEILTPGFVVVCFGIGALLAAIPALLGLHIAWQVAIFIAGSFLSLFFLRPFVRRISKHQEEQLTGADALIGKTARVVRVIGPNNLQGRVAIDGDEWLAQATQKDLCIEEGSMVEVVDRESIVLTVKPHA